MSNASAPSPTPAPRPDWTEVVSAVSSVVTMLVTIIALSGIWFQFASYKESAQEESERRVRDAYSKLYTMDMNLWAFAGQNPVIMEAIISDKDGAVLQRMSQDDRRQFEATCQMIGDVFEYYCLIEPDLKGVEWASQNNCWIGYIALIYRQSAGFRAYIKSTKSEWTTGFLARLAATPLEE